MGVYRFWVYLEDGWCWCDEASKRIDQYGRTYFTCDFTRRSKLCVFDGCKWYGFIQRIVPYERWWSDMDEIGFL